MRDAGFQFYLLWKRGIIRVHAAQFFAWQNIFPIVVIPQGLTLFPKKESIKGGSVPKRLLSLYVFLSLGFHSLFVTSLVLHRWWNFLCGTLGRASQGLCNKFFLVEICSRGEEKTPKMEKKLGVPDLLRPSRAHGNLPFHEDVCFFSTTHSSCWYFRAHLDW